MTTAIDPTALDKIKAELVPLINAYLDQHPELATQYASVAETLPGAGPVPEATDAPDDVPEAPEADLGALDTLLDDVQDVMEAEIPQALEDSSDADLGIAELMDEDADDDVATDSDADEDDEPGLDEATLQALLVGELGEEGEARIGAVELIVEYQD